MFRWNPRLGLRDILIHANQLLLYDTRTLVEASMSQIPSCLECCETVSTSAVATASNVHKPARSYKRGEQSVNRVIMKGGFWCNEKPCKPCLPHPARAPKSPSSVRQGLKPGAIEIPVSSCFLRALNLLHLPEQRTRRFPLEFARGERTVLHHQESLAFFSRMDFTTVPPWATGTEPGIGA